MGRKSSLRNHHYLWLIVACLLLYSCASPKERTFKETRRAMYTVTAITVVTASEEKAQRAIDAAFREIGKLEKLMNYYDAESEVSAINHNAGAAPVKVSSETLDVIEKALFASVETDGAFDVTVGPLVKLWDFRSEKIPGAVGIEQAKRRVDYRRVILDKKERTVFLARPGMEIDLGGILKGYAADRAAEVLKKEGIASGLVTVGGEVKAFGVRPGGMPWNVGITNPRKTGPEDEIVATVRLTDKAISTSGDYERFFIRGGTRYHHILDPATGSPAPLCRSVTVIAPEGAMADAFSTGIFVLGPEKGINLLTRLGLDGLIIDNGGGIHITKGLENRIEFVRK